MIRSNIRIAIAVTASIFMLAVTSASASEMAEMTLSLVDRVGLTPEAREEMQREAMLPWRMHGVQACWSSGTSVEANDIIVIITRTADEEADRAERTDFVKVRPLASILFVDGQPTRMIQAYPMEALRLLSAVRIEDKGWNERPRVLRERLMGRVLGRALAHEIGHYLFASADHAAFGLMRATHRIDQLIAPAPGHAFDIIAPQPRPRLVGVATTRRPSRRGRRRSRC